MRVLNLGCGEDTYGTDFVDLIPQRPEVIRADIGADRLPFENGIFDEVLMKFSIEHVGNPLFALMEALRVLRKDGVLKLYTDNSSFIGFHIPGTAFWDEHNTNNPRVSKDDRHYFLFTRLHIKNLLETAGFRKIKVRYYYNPAASKMAQYAFPLALLLKRFLFPHIFAEAVK